MAHVKLRNATLHFPVYSAAARSLKKRILRRAKRTRIADDEGHIVVRALEGIDLELNDGDRLGLIGRNGAGKTSLLRVLAGVYEPSAGTVEVAGRVTPIFDIGLGIDPEATGLENIYLRGALLGMRKAELASMVPSIADFVELDDYLDMPVRTYSAGMSLRLAFAISTCVSSDVLVMDEFFAVGDEAFIRKAEARMTELVHRASIIVLASHSRDILRRFCNKALWLDSGLVKGFGDLDEVLAAYQPG
jgi:ABC-type polysaccharide/polyol phosphate transport system ATPase subunit